MQRLLMVMLLAAAGCGLFAGSGAATAQESETGSKAVNRNARGPAVAGRRPGLWVQRGLSGPEITQTPEERDEPSRLQSVYIDLLTTLFTALNELIPLLPDLFEGQDGVAGVDLVITEIANDGENTFIEVFYPNGPRLELDPWGFCGSEDCTGGLELAGRVMEQGDFLVLQLDGNLDNEVAQGVLSLQVGTSADEIAVYDFTGVGERDPGDEVAMASYIRWGDPLQPLPLQDTAIAAGQWPQRNSIEANLRNSSFQLASGRSLGRNAEAYIVVPFDQNSLGQATPSNLEPGGGDGDGDDNENLNDNLAP